MNKGPEGHPLIPDYELNGDGSINPMEEAEDSLNPLPANQDEIDAKKPQTDDLEQL